jgi:hypothetical protein
MEKMEISQNLNQRLHSLKLRIEQEIIPELGLKEQELSSYNHNLFSISKLGEDYSEVKRGLKALGIKFAKLGKQELSEVTNQIILLQGDIDQEPRRKFQEKAKQYFEWYFEGNLRDIVFDEKKRGIQLGNKIILTLTDGQELIYHAKTHRLGLKSQHSSSSQPVDAKELFIYKVLELSDLGSESHFFYDDEKNFYIATRDVGFNKESKKQERFVTYDQVKPSLKEFNDLLKDDGNIQLVEEKLGRNQIDFVNGLIKADIFSRVFRLHDLINNDGNIGFVENEIKEKYELKIIDFDVKTDISYEDKEGIFKGFQSGNGQYNYIGSNDNIIKYFLGKRDFLKRKEIAKDIFKEDGKKIYQAIEQSYNEIKIFIEKSNLQVDFLDLEKYAKSVSENLLYFMNRLVD